MEMIIFIGSDSNTKVVKKSNLSSHIVVATNATSLWIGEPFLSVKQDYDWWDMEVEN